MKNETKQQINYYTKQTRGNAKEIYNLFWSIVDTGSTMGYCTLSLFPVMGMIYVPMGAALDLAAFPYRLVKSHVSEIENDKTKIK